MPTPPLSLVIFLPALGALLIALLPSDHRLIKRVAVAITLADLVFALALWAGFDASTPTSSTPKSLPGYPP